MVSDPRGRSTAASSAPLVPIDRDALRSALTTAASTGHGHALLLMDLDRFKSVNDSRGLAVGDAVLREADRRICDISGPNGIVMRAGADEFAVLLPSIEAAETLALRLLEGMRRPFETPGGTLRMSASIGIAVATRHLGDADALIRCAGIALHQSETDGCDRWRRFEPWMMESASSQHLLESALRDALEFRPVDFGAVMRMEQFEVHYQPQVVVEGRRLSGLEALVRWRHPERGLVGPNEFIPVAESTGLIGRLGEWVLRTACQDAALWPRSELGDAPRVAVNVSPCELRDEGALVSRIDAALHASGLTPDRLEIEVTESALNRDVLDALRNIKALGVGLALDDFGTGYSCLSQLAQYPFDRLKIDRSFVRDLRAASPLRHSLHTDNGNAAATWMIQAIASLGAGLRLDTIAEGVETESQAELVRQAGATEMQGYLISRAMPAAQVPAWISAYGDRNQPSRIRLA